MFSIYKHFSLSFVVIALILNLFLSGCSLTDHDSSLKPNPFGTLNQKSSWYEGQLSSSEPEYNYDWQILLARSYAAEGDTNRALDMINQMRKNAITPLQGNQADIIEAQIKARQGNYQGAFNLLSSVNSISLPKTTANYFYLLKGNVADNLGKHLTAAQSYMSAAENLSSDSKNEAYKRCLNSLNKTSTKELYSAFKSTDDQIEKGFYEYALIQKSKNDMTRNRLMSRFEKKYAGHPVLSIVDKNSVSVNNNTENVASTNVLEKTQSGDTIAVFLPLSGKYAEIIGNPTKLGILNAYKDRGIDVNLKFYDSESGPIEDLYKMSLKDNAKAIIGPIIKSEVDQLLKLNPQIPVIALNEGSINSVKNVYYLTLAPENDAFNAVNEIAKDNLSNPMIIAPNNEKGKRLSLAFNEFWHDRTNINTSVCYFTDVNSLQDTLKTCFASTNGIFDAAYIYGTANEASVIREYVKQVTNNVPMFYIGAKSNNGISNNSAISGVNGMKMGDQPWLLKESTIKQQIIDVLPKANGDTLRCFAIGYDSLNLALNLGNLVSDKTEMIRGLSGDIHIDNSGELQRDLTWIIVGSN